MEKINSKEKFQIGKKPLMIKLKKKVKNTVLRMKPIWTLGINETK
jgi:hypothetical protein